MPMLRLLKASAFDAEATDALASAFNTAWDVLRKSGSTLAADKNAITTRQVLANQIIAMVRAGERDHQRLVKNALLYVASCKTISRGVAGLRANVNRRRSSKRVTHDGGEV